jgi:O-6-methylguanine DNA methyltransferase
MTLATFETDEGTFRAWFTERGLAALSFPSGRSEQPDDTNVPSTWKRQTAEAVQTVLRGKQPGQLPPLDLARGTDFQQRVWKALLTITAGKTRSYGEVAAMIGMPEAARAVGAACGANPIPVLIPCHRVLAANRLIGGFSAGLKWKRVLLDREGVTLNSPGQRDSSGLAQDRRRRNSQLALWEGFAQKLDKRRVNSLE